MCVCAVIPEQALYSVYLIIQHHVPTGLLITCNLRSRSKRSRDAMNICVSIACCRPGGDKPREKQGQCVLSQRRGLNSTERLAQKSVLWSCLN